MQERPASEGLLAGRRLGVTGNRLSRLSGRRRKARMCVRVCVCVFFFFVCVCVCMFVCVCVCVFD